MVCAIIVSDQISDLTREWPSNGATNATATHERCAAGVRRGALVGTYSVGVGCAAQRPRFQPCGGHGQPTRGERGSTEPREATPARSGAPSLPPVRGRLGYDVGRASQYPQSERTTGRGGPSVVTKTGWIEQVEIFRLRPSGAMNPHYKRRKG
jgi:hypothetical protein